ncbi:F-box family protein [Klebsormidium nitens]|uniref:F-box family protein n=1 Tax=Klebsormidium nitens TaxID=105231 RepID=A0A1Y1HY14_KLENI|nr:F-box family protein [Klebsormidium nitens]|eukprot:GAQ83053.1 F-box family protein [Klebsormidium nitens]
MVGSQWSNAVNVILSVPFSSSMESLNVGTPHLEVGEESTLLSLTDDLLGNILSRLPHSSIESAACCCHRLLSIVRDDERTWLPACVNRWGGRTNVRSWGGGRVAYRALFHVLRQCDKLAGFWRAVSDSDFKHGSSLVSFEWLPTHLEALRIVPACQNSYQVRKIPFLRVGVSPLGEFLCRESGDEDWDDLARSIDFGSGENRPGVIGPMSNGPGVKRSAVNAGSLNGTSEFGANMNRGSENGEGVYRGSVSAAPEINSEAAQMTSRLSESSLSDLDDVGPSESPMRTPSPGGHRAPSPGPKTAQESSLQLSFVAPDHIVLEERRPQPKPWSFEAEAAASASLGIGHSWRRRSSSPTGAQTPPLPACGSSPPGTFNYEIYQFLSSRVASPGGLRQRARRKERERSERQGRVPAQAEHFVRIPEATPTAERPLQGLWKAIGALGGLDIVHVSYSAQEMVKCRQLCDVNTAHVAPSPKGVQWWAVPIELTRAEQRDYESRGHIDPASNAELIANGMDYRISDGQVGIHPEAIAVLSFVGSDFRERRGLAQRGRMWEYAAGEFGWGLMSGGENWIMDYKRLVEGRTVLDSIQEIH